MPTFQQLKTRVGSYLIDQPSATTALVGDWINKAVREAEEMHDFRHMEAETTFTTASTRVLGSKPSSWKRTRAVPWYVRDDGSIQEFAWASSETDMHRQYDGGDEEDGPPEFLLETLTGFEVYPFPDAASDYLDGEYRIHVPYWAYSTAMTASGATNFFTDNAEWYLTFKAAAEGMLFNRDRDEATVYFQRAAQELRRIVTDDKRSRATQPRMLVPRTGVYKAARRPPRRI